MNLLRSRACIKQFGAACALGLVILLSGCGSDVYTKILPPPPPPPPPPPISEPNSCKTIDTTSPAQPTPTSNVAGPAFTGVVKAGSQTLSAASVMLYAAGTGGDGTGAKALLKAPILTDTNGLFSIPANFTCPSSNTVLYVVSTGGRISFAVNASDPDDVQFAAILGTCGSLTGGASFTLNEATTVAAAYAMSQFLSVDPTSLAATATNSSGIALAAATAANLVDPKTGAVPGAGFPVTGAAPITKINSLANLLDACVDFSSAPAGPPCQQIFTAAYGPTGKGPTEAYGETFGAAISVAKHAATNVATLYTLSQASTVYQPALAVPPADWTLVANYTGGRMNGSSAVSIDSTGRVWVSSYFDVASQFTNTGAPILGITGNHLENTFGGAVDVNDAFWAVNEESSSGVNNGLGSISVFNSAGTLQGHYIAGGIDFPLAVAFDTSGVAWVVDYGQSRVTLLDPNGIPLSGADGYMPKNYFFPVAVATDAKCNAYLANQSSNTITLSFADGSGFTDFVVGQGPSGVAVDPTGNIWSANYYADSIGLVSSSGQILSGAGITGGGVDHPQGIAADGAGNAWVANYRAPGITELAAATTPTPGAFLSPGNGWAIDSGIGEAFGLAIDASGNIWITQFGSNTLTELIGIAAPVQTPLLGPVRVP